MTLVYLGIDKYLDGGFMTGAAVVDIRRINGAEHSPKVARAAVSIGAPPWATANTVELSPGKYEFTAVLPSGEVLSQVREISPHEANARVTFSMGHSPHEWMSWQHALGNAVGVETLNMLRFSQSKVRWSLVDDIDAFLFSTQAQLSHQELRTPVTQVNDSLPRLSSRIGSPLAVTPLHGLKEPPYKVYHVPLEIISDPGYRAAEFARHYALVQDRMGRGMLCILPVPWRTSHFKQAMAEILVGPDQQIDADEAQVPGEMPWSVSTIVRDDTVASVLGYFAAGDTRSAAFLVDKAQDMLFRKMENPLAAAAGAYVLMDQWLRRSSMDAMEPEWLQWISNLARWFPWLPDGEILRGWVALARPQQRSPFETARGAFLEAERRGIPYFSAGVRRLMDGLSRIAGQDKADGREDLAVVEALKRVRRLAWDTDRRFPFTTIRLQPEQSVGPRDLGRFGFSDFTIVNQSFVT